MSSIIKVDTIQLADGTAGTIENLGLATGALSHRNLIINGAMQVAQRGTSSTSTGYGSVDRFKLLKEGLGEFAFTQSQDTTSPDLFSHSFKIDTTTPESASGSGDLIRVAQNIEAQNLQHLGFGTSAAKSFTVSFWVRSSVTGTYAIHFYRPDNTARNITANYSVSSADTWEYKTITIVGDTSQVVNNDNGEGMTLYWVLRAGSTFTASDASSWENWDYTGLAYGHTADWGSATGNDFYLTGVQLEVGSVATPFEHRSYSEELARCQRYYRSYSRGVRDDNIGNLGTGYDVNTTLCDITLLLSPRMRTAPTLEYSSAAAISIYDGSGHTTTAIVLDGSKTEQVLIRNTTSGLTSNVAATVNLINSNYIALDAEL